MKEDVIQAKEIELYIVEKAQNKNDNNKDGWAIFLNGDTLNPLNKELIFGLDEDKEGKNKAFLDYWCARLNRSFVQGWALAKGYNVCYPSEGYFKALDELYEKWTSMKLKKNNE